MVESYSITRILLDHFFRRFFDNDTLQVDGDTQTTVVRALSIVAVPELLITFFLQLLYTPKPFLRQQRLHRVDIFHAMQHQQH